MVEMRPGQLWAGWKVKCAKCPTLFEEDITPLLPVSSMAQSLGWHCGPETNWKWVCPECKEAVDASTTE